MTHDWLLSYNLFPFSVSLVISTRIFWVLIHRLKNNNLYITMFFNVLPLQLELNQLQRETKSHESQHSPIRFRSSCVSVKLPAILGLQAYFGSSFFWQWIPWKMSWPMAYIMEPLWNYCSTLAFIQPWPLA